MAMVSREDKMVQDNRFDLARLERMERRLQMLEDVEAIRNLKARYAALCDNQYDANGIASLLPRMRFGKVPRWAASKGATRSGTSSWERRASSSSITA